MSPLRSMRPTTAILTPRASARSNARARLGVRLRQGLTISIRCSAGVDQLDEVAFERVAADEAARMWAPLADDAEKVVSSFVLDPP